jgi:LCP family protein required for cell wall assembly
MHPHHDQPGPPLPPRLDPRAGRGRRGASRHRAGDHRSLVTAVRVLCGLLSLAILVGTGWGWDLARVAESSVTRTDAIPQTGNSDANGSKHAGSEMNLLLVGMDSRKGLTPEQQDEYATGDPDGLLNTDTMMLVHIPVDGSAASFVSFPRDTYASIPGHGKGKLNSAYADGYNAAQGTDAEKDAAGAQLLIQTISHLSGLQIDHFAEVNLLGFINLSNIVGGVTVNICEPTDDSATGAHFDAGVQTLSGKDALLFVRERHGLRRGDVDRVVRQQVYIAGLIRNVLSSKLLLNLSKQKQIVEQVGSSITVDQGLDLFDLASQMQSVQPGNITFQTIPGLTDAKVDGWGAVLELPSQQILTTFFSTLTNGDAASSSSAAPSSSAPATETVAPSQVTVSVLNGSGVTGAASTAASTLAQAGFHATSGGNVTRTATTTIRYRSGDDAAAATLAAKIPGATLTADDTLAAGHLTLTLGSDFTTVGQQIAAAPTSSNSAETTVPGSYANNERTAADTSCIN